MCCFLVLQLGYSNYYDLRTTRLLYLQQRDLVNMERDMEKMHEHEKLMEQKLELRESWVIGYRIVA